MGLELRKRAGEEETSFWLGGKDRTYMYIIASPVGVWVLPARRPQGLRTPTWHTGCCHLGWFNIWVPCPGHWGRDRSLNYSGEFYFLTLLTSAVAFTYSFYGRSIPKKQPGPDFIMQVCFSASRNTEVLLDITFSLLVLTPCSLSDKAPNCALWEIPRNTITDSQDRMRLLPCWTASLKGLSPF